MGRESPFYHLFIQNESSTLTGASPRPGRLPWKVQCALVMLMTLVISLAGLAAMPIEGHEIFVVQTTSEMQARGDWVVPYFDHELRLKKPPLNYWLTEAVAKLSMDSHIQPWHARMVSALSGCLIIAMILWCGVLLGAPSLGVTAGLIGATSIAYLMFIHDGRPDMLYAGMCTTMFALWLAAWREKKPWRSALFIYGMWVFAALATLSKGPHIPLLFVVLFSLITWMTDRSWGDCWKLIRPITGLALMLALSVPWWILLYLRVGDRLFESQLTGSRYDFSFWAIFNPYYFYRTFVVILPWCVLWIFAGAALLEKNTHGRLARLMMILILGTLIALTLASGKRIVYVLPLLGPMSLLMAIGARRLIHDARTDPKFSKLIRHFYSPMYMAVAVILIVVTSMLHRHRLWSEGRWWIPIVCVLGCLVTGWLVMRLARQKTGRRDWPIVVTLRGAAVIFAWFLISSNLTGAAANPSRWQYKAGAQVINAHEQPGELLYALDVDTQPFIYYARRRIIQLENRQALQAVLQKSPNGLDLLTTRRTQAKLSENFSVQKTTKLFTLGHEDFRLLHVVLPTPSATQPIKLQPPADLPVAATHKSDTGRTSSPIQ